MRLLITLLQLLCLAACGSGESVFPPSLGLASTSQSCSTDPDHGPNGWIDPTNGRRAAEVFPDSKAATLADAVKRDDIEKIKRLLDEGSDASASGEGGVTILDWALRREKADAFNVLLQSGADPTKPGLQGRSTIHDAAIADDSAYLSMLVARHADINVKTQDGETPLVLALMSGCDKQFHMLIAAGADVNLANSVGNTALHTAAMTNKFNDQLDLLKAGADPLARNNTGNTFQRYLHMTPESVLSVQAKAQIASIHQWLNDHHIPIEARLKEEVMPWQHHN
jgi:uncharacterized protein